jgi:hypothetical protein
MKPSRYSKTITLNEKSIEVELTDKSIFEHIGGENT